MALQTLEATVAALLDGSYRDALHQHDEVSHAPFPCMMADIETFSLHAGAAFMLSLGLIPFSLTLDGPRFGPPTLLIFDVMEQLLSARRIDEGTRKFWRDQPPKARAHFTDPDYVGFGGARPQPCRLAQLADKVDQAMRAHCIPKAEIYSQGIAFDLSNLSAAMADEGRKAPWEYWAATDARTLRRKLPKRRTAPKLDIPGAVHDPVFDSVKQIWGLWEVATDEMLGLEALPNIYANRAG